MRFIALRIAIVALLSGALFVFWDEPADDCATKCAAAAQAEREAQLAAAEGDEAHEDCDDGECPEKDAGCKDCAFCMCCASMAPAATVATMSTGHPPLPQPDRRDSATCPGLTACAGFVPGVFKPPRA